MRDKKIIMYKSILLWSFILLNLSSCENHKDRIHINFWAMGAEGENVQKLIPQFQLNNPGIVIRVQMIPWTAAQEKLITAYASGNLPDIFQLGNTWIPQFVALDAIENLSPWIKKSSIINKQNYFSGIFETNEIKGFVYGIPWYVDTRVLFYRIDTFHRAGYSTAPNTWEQLLDLSRKIKKLYEGQEKFAIYLPTNEWAPFVIFGLQAGSTLLRSNNSYGNFSGKKFKRAFEFLMNIHHEKLAPLGISQVTNVYQAFADNYFAMYISGPWNVKEFKKWMIGDLEDKWMTAPLPGLNDTTVGVSLAGGASLVMAKSSKKKEKVWKFIEFLSLPSSQLKFYKIVNALPALREVWNNEEITGDPYMQAFYRQLHHVVPTPKIPEWEQIAFSKIQQYAEIAARKERSIDETLRLLDEDVNRILGKRRWLLKKNHSD
jgi:multiple sugar transport system substrate-binding protein